MNGIKNLHRAVLVVLIAMLAVPFGPAAAQETAASSGLPIAHGVSELFSDGNGQGAWRVVSDTAALASDAQAVERAVGFTLAGDEPVLVENETTGVTDLVPAHGAVFVRERDVEKRSSVGSEAASYMRVALVLPSEVNDQANGTLVFAGPSFDVPGGARSIVLNGLELDADTQGVAPESAVPVLVVVSSGSVTLADGSTLGEGEAGEVSAGDAFTANADGTRVSLGVVGDEVDVDTGSGGQSAPAATPVPTDDDDDATQFPVEISAVDCTLGDIDSQEGCTPLEGVTFTVARGDATSSSETGVTTDAEGNASTEIPEGYNLTVTYAEGAGDLLPLYPTLSMENVTEAQELVFVFVPGEAEESVTMTLVALDCTNGDAASGEGCTPLAGVTLVVTTGNDTSSSESGVTTGEDGSATFEVTLGNDVSVTSAQDVPQGLVLFEGGISISDVQADTSVNVPFVPAG